ncbi:MAG: hypothetical protein HY920_04475 [Elusimicrobia bacterium]|nr:hypothetical protein [Elusimicrobiota bacterium]
MRKLEISYVESDLTEKERLNAIVQLMAGGICQYLKTEEGFVENQEIGKRAREIVRDCQKLLDDKEYNQQLP